MPVLQGSAEDAYQDPNADQEDDRGQVQSPSADADRGQDASYGQYHGVDDSIEQVLHPPQRVHRGDPDPGEDHPRKDRVEVDLQEGYEDVDHSQSMSSSS